MKTKFQILAFLSLILVIVLASACQPAPVEVAGAATPVTVQPTQSQAVPTSTPTVEVVPTEIPGRTQLIVAMAAEPEIMDIQQSYDSSMVHRWISQPLIEFSADMSTMVPDLATSWDISEDGLTIDWHLIEGYKYSNGDTLDAAALKAAWERYKQISPYTYDFDPISELNVINDNTLEAIHSVPPAPMWVVLASPFGAPFDAAVATEIGDEAFSRAPVASGPFYIKEWESGSYILLARNDYYHTNMPYVENKGPVNLEEVMVRFIPEGLTRVSELEAGTVDVVIDLPSSEVQRFTDNPDIDVVEMGTPGFVYVLFNHAAGPFADPKLRAAVALAVNRDDLVTTLDNTVEPQYAYLTPANMNYSEEMQQYAMDKYPYDIEAAKAMLADAGWTDSNGDGIVEKGGEPLSVVLAVNSDKPDQSKIAPVIQAQLQSIGMDVSIEMFGGGTIKDEILGNEYDFALYNFSWSDPDILTYLVGLNGDTPSKYVNPEVDELLDAARYELDMQKRTAIYEEMQTILIDDVVFVPLYSKNLFIGVRKEVKGLFVNSNSGALFLNDVTIEQ